MKQQLCKMILLCIWCSLPFYNSVLSDNSTFSCTLSGMLAHYCSDRFIQGPFLIVLRVSITLVIGSSAICGDVF